MTDDDFQRWYDYNEQKMLEGGWEPDEEPWEEDPDEPTHEYECDQCDKCIFCGECI